MPIKKAVGRTPVMNYRMMMRIADLLQHNTTVTDICRTVKISRQTYYYYLHHEAVFAETMATAKANQNKVVFSFLTI